MRPDASSPPAPISVLQVLACDEVGGTEAMVATLVEGMSPVRVSSMVATLDVPGLLARRLTSSGVAVYSLGRGRLRASVALVRLLRRGQFDVVVAYGMRATLLVRVLVRLARPRPAFVCGVRGLLVTEAPSPTAGKARFALALERMLSRLVDVYDANSRGALAILASHGVDARRLRYIPNGVDVTRWASPNGARPGAAVVACVARFTPIKRHRDLVEAIARLRADGLDVRAVLAGDGPTRPAVEALLRDHGLADAVSLPGSLDSGQVAALLHEASVFCLASGWEGMPGAVLEAMAAGLPVVGTRVNGIEDVVEDGVTGRLVPPGNPEALADALREVLADPERAQAWGEAGRRRVAEHFTIEGMVRAKEQLYLEAARGV